MKGWVLAVLLAASGVVAQYPRYEMAVRSPKEFDLLYPSTSGSHNESWYFNDNNVTLTSFIMPSQMFPDFCTSDQWTDGVYQEELDIFIYETKRISSTSTTTLLVATGSFNGTARFSQELDIPVRNPELNRPLRITGHSASVGGCWYTVSTVFKKSGVYPWYSTRTFTNFSPVKTHTNAGIVIGLSYTYP